ncbi:hypothetical protein [Mesorhizobium sp.]|uniref:hypothetical protein n=1 Tax=Mesorhizobium sp. TaxID=1871066 RepID=UPI00257F595A|nr:hypothetical protein [Mesorhizobium sp.]
MEQTHFSRTAILNESQDQAKALFLGIDTGGTYTDAVLWSETEGPQHGPNKGKDCGLGNVSDLPHKHASCVFGPEHREQVCEDIANSFACYRPKT